MKPTRWISTSSLPIILFLFTRIPLILALPFDGLRGYGDLQHFFNLAAIPGLPFVDYWIEFPPGFAFLNELIYFLAGGVEHVYTYLFVLVLLAADTGSVILFQELEKTCWPKVDALNWRSLLFAAVLAGLPYAWWYFDSLAVFFLLLAIYLLFLKQKIIHGGLALGAGILVKLFPGLLLPLLFKVMKPRQAAAATLVAISLFVFPNLVLYAFSQDFTAASLVSQLRRGSAETVWALLDGNYQTGNFGPLAERLEPGKAYQSTRHPAAVPPFIPLILLGGIGLYALLRGQVDWPRQAIALLGLTLVLFFIWSPGWSPQWVLYLLPVILLVLDFPLAILIISTMVLVNLLEWPVLLSRGLFYTLPLTVILRFFLLVMLGLLFYQNSRKVGDTALEINQT